MKFVNEYQAAEYLSLSSKTLSRWRWMGKGPRFHKFGTAVRYSLDDLDSYIGGAEVAR